MIEIDVRSDLREVAARFNRTVQDKMRPAVARALNRTATTVRKESSSEIRKVFNIKAGAAKGQLRIVRASAGKLEASVIASGRPIPLIEFAARETARGVTVKVKRRGGRKLIPGAFIAQMANGHTGVFIRAKTPAKLRVKRTGRGSPRKAPKYSDLPIAELLSLSMAKAFVNEEVLKVLERVARQRFGTEFEREITFLAGRL